MQNNIFKKGILGGIIAAIVMASMVYYMKTNPGQEPNAIIGFACMLLAFVFIILGIKQERAINNGTITFGRAFLTGLAISFIISTIYVLVWLVIYYNFFPDFMEKYSEMALKNTSPEELAAKTTEMNQMAAWYKNPLMIILLTYMEIFPLGIVISLIGALFLKKK
jgi:asparagine N-glycosylation enzyme membrane subunit Stt3